MSASGSPSGVVAPRGGALPSGGPDADRLTPRGAGWSYGTIRWTGLPRICTFQVVRSVL